MNNLAIFERAARRELTPEEAADLLMQQRPRGPQRPSWMPRFVFALAMGLLTFLVPSLSERRA